jgi:hypothetical protein
MKGAPGRIPVETLAPKNNATIFAEKAGTSAPRRVSPKMGGYVRTRLDGVGTLKDAVARGGIPA